MTITNRNEITFIKADKQHLELVNECFIARIFKSFGRQMRIHGITLLTTF
jgi:hypothetical protein